MEISSLKIFKQPAEENLCLCYEERVWGGHCHVTSFVGLIFHCKIINYRILRISSAIDHSYSKEFAVIKKKMKSQPGLNRAGLCNSWVI